MPAYALTLLTLFYAGMTATAVLAALYLIVPAAYRRQRRNKH